MLFSARGTTDLSMKSVAFATEGTENFLEGALKIDTQDFLGKMEGFAIAGVKGISLIFILISLSLIKILKVLRRIISSVSLSPVPIFVMKLVKR